MTKRRYTLKPVSLLFCLVLAACGGGGNSGTPTSTSGAAGTSGNTSSSANTGSGSGSSSGNSSSSTSGSSTSESGGNSSSSGGGSTSSFQYDATARFNTPTNLTIDKAGNLYVVDSGNQAIRKIAANGQVSTLPGTYPAGTQIAIDPSGNLIALLQNNLYRITPTGTQTLIYSFPQGDYGDFTPQYISADSQGRIYLLGYRSSQDVTVIRIDTDNVQTTLFSGGTQGWVMDITSDAMGNVVIGSVGYDLPVLLNTPNNKGLYDIPLSHQNSKDGSGGQVVPNRGMPMNSINKIVDDADGNTYVVDVKIDTSAGQPDTLSNLRILKVTPSGTVTTILNGFPSGKISYTVPANAESAFGLALGADGNLYLSDPYSNAIYKVAMSGQTTLIAGKEGEAGSSD